MLNEERSRSSWAIWGDALHFYSENLHRLFFVLPLFFVPFFSDCFVSEIIRQERDNDGNLNISSAALSSVGRVWSDLSMRLRFLVPSILWAYIPVYGWYRDFEHRVDMSLVSNVVVFEGLTGTLGVKKCVELRNAADWKMTVRSLLEIPTLLGLILISSLVCVLTFAPFPGAFAIFVALLLFISFPLSAAVNTFFYLIVAEPSERAAAAQKERKPASKFEDFCPNCVNLDNETGVCRRLSENVRAYPKKFRTECGGKYYNGISN